MPTIGTTVIRADSLPGRLPVERRALRQQSITAHQLGLLLTPSASRPRKFPDGCNARDADGDSSTRGAQQTGGFLLADRGPGTRVAASRVRSTYLQRRPYGRAAFAGLGRGIKRSTTSLHLVIRRQRRVRGERRLVYLPIECQETTLNGRQAERGRRRRSARDVRGPPGVARLEFGQRADGGRI